MLQYDIGLDANGDIDISTGDFLIVLSDQQHIKDIIYSNAGFWRNFPYVGVGIFNYLQDNTTDQALIQNIKTQLQADGYVVNSVTVKHTLVNGQPGIIINNDASRP